MLNCHVKMKDGILQYNHFISNKLLNSALIFIKFDLRFQEKCLEKLI